VLILYNEPVLPAGHADFASEHEILATVEVVAKHLLQADFEVSRFGVRTDGAALLQVLARRRPDVVFNLFEGTAGHGQSEGYLASLLEWQRIPFTGCPSQALAVGRNKPLTKYLLQGAGLPTPPFITVERPPPPEWSFAWPAIVKPAQEDASAGLDQGSVVRDQEHLHVRVTRILKMYGPVLVEEYIPGRELNVALVETPGLRTLPISEIMFIDKDPSHWPIVTYDAKWSPGSLEYESTPGRYPAEVDSALARRVEELAVRAFRLLGCRDYGRVDFRVRPSGEPYILEVNPNPAFNPDAGLARGLACAGIDHAEFTVRLVQNALARG
jgi:D-alanine-D-alanine ligase